MALRLLVGLGNPGPQYAGTRHNVGFAVADALWARWGGSSWRNLGHSGVSEVRGLCGPIVIAKPQTFMNRSGVAVKALLERWPLELSSVLVLHDDLDLPFGALRIRVSGGHGGHNGVRSLMETLGSGDFLRLKVGIGRPAEKEAVVDYVLSSFGPDEIAELPSLLGRAAEAAEAVLLEGPTCAMNRFHS